MSPSYIDGSIEATSTIRDAHYESTETYVVGVDAHGDAASSRVPAHRECSIYEKGGTQAPGRHRMPLEADADQWEMVTAVGEIAGDDQIVRRGALTRRCKSDKHRAAPAARDRVSNVTRGFEAIDLES